MAVIVRKRMFFGNKETELKTYQPPGRISRKERLHADRLDMVLQKRIPKIVNEVLKITPKSSELVRRWYTLGHKLREIVDDPALVSNADIASGIIWDAIWFYLPDSMKPAHLGDTALYSEQKQKRKDPLLLCYEISAFNWLEVEWIQRWSDWYEIASRPGLVRDKRILQTLGQEIKHLQRYPSRDEFREIAKSLKKGFPSRRLRESSLFEDAQILRIVRESVKSVVN